MQREMSIRTSATTTVALALLASLAGTPAALAQSFPVTAGQKATAEQVAQAGVPLTELAPDAPDNYTVKSGDTRIVSVGGASAGVAAVRSVARPSLRSSTSFWPG